MIKTILFDLDGTLLPMDIRVFLSHYMKALAARFAKQIPPEKFIASLMHSTDVMIHNTNPAKTNQQVFWEDFLSRFDLEPAKILPEVEDFYQEDFPKLRVYTNPTPLARQIMEVVTRAGYQVILATNAIFPEMAIRERMRWAGVEDFPWLLITSYEKMHSSKPNPAYYQEIVQLTGIDPETSLMVGNDPAEDVVAGEIGMKTYLVTDYLIPRPEVGLSPDAKGTLGDFLALVRNGSLNFS